MQIKLCKTTKEKRCFYACYILCYLRFLLNTEEKAVQELKSIYIVLPNSLLDFELPVIERLTSFKLKKRESCSIFSQNKRNCESYSSVSHYIMHTNVVLTISSIKFFVISIVQTTK